MTKRCGRCKRDLPTEDFGRNRRSKDGLAVYCRPCAREVHAEWRAKNPDKPREYAAKHYAKDPAKKLAQGRSYREKNRERTRAYAREYARGWRAKNAEHVAEYRQEQRAANVERWNRSRRNTRLKAAYGITLEQYEAMLDAQGGVCAICAAPPGAKPLFVDHCHDSKVVRGLLCSKCNFAVGQLDNSPERARRVIAYLQR